MDLSVITQDTRGGVQPYAALARALVAAGHTVRAVAPADYAWLFERAGVRCLPLEGVSAAASREIALEAQRSRHGGLRTATRAMAERVPGWAIQMRDFANGSDLLTGGVGGSVIGQPVAASLGVPWVPAHLQPVGLLNPAYPGVLMSGLPRALGAAGNLLGQLLTEAAIRVPFAPVQRAARTALGSSGAAPTSPGSVYGISPAVIPAPTPGKRNQLVAGYWFDDDSDALPPEVEQFLEDADGPVISAGFGSMVAADTQALRDLLGGAARDVGARVVLIAGAGAVGGDPVEPGRSGVLTLPSIPHRALFHRMAANVHHGGAGTTASAFAAGVPGVIVPFGADQPFWGRRALDLGVAPAPIPLKSLTRDGLARALRQALTDPAMRGRAAELGVQIRSEDGVGVAARWFGALRV